MKQHTFPTFFINISWAISHVKTVVLIQTILTDLFFFSARVPSLFAADPPADPFSCSPTQPCKIGCCGKNNVCGLGPDYCSAENCVSSCDQKSD
ncbi:hypothetical protein MPER_11464, partial [Moniliophthora perniciosa FA553]